MKVLRDLRLSTKLLILLEITSDPHVKLKKIAEKLDMTVQGASEYLKRMSNEELVQNIGGEYRATKEGVEFLHHHFLELKEFVDGVMRNLALIESCAAIAKTPIKKGDRVGLFMECGRLTAYAGKHSKSTGTALTSADVGEDVAVTELEGIVKLSLGKLYIVELPNIESGGSRAASISKIKKLYLNFKPDKLCAMDTVGLVVIKKLKCKCDFEFSPIASTIDAIQKGLNVMVFSASENVRKLVSAIEEINTTSPDKVKYKMFSAYG